MHWITIICLLALPAFPPAADAEGIYRWTDADGQVHYGDNHPVNTDAEQIKGAKGGDAATVERLQRQQEFLHTYEQQRIEKQEQAAKTQQERDNRAAKCTEAKHRLTRLQQARFIYETTDAGERRILDDTERQASESKAQAEIQRWCN